MIENWKSNLNKGNKIGAVFMDLSTSSDTLDQSLLIAKLELYGFDSISLEFTKNYLANRKHVGSEIVLVYGENPCFLTSS